jgi:dipeptide transport system ATP-binding protein
MTPVLEGKNIVRNYFLPGGLFKKEKTVHAVKGVNFKVEQGKTLAIVGESGCGKSTLARIITMIDPGQRRRAVHRRQEGRYRRR